MHDFMLSANLFYINFFFKFPQKNLYQQCQTVSVLIRPNMFCVRPDLGPCCLQRLSADDTGRKTCKELINVPRAVMESMETRTVRESDYSPASAIFDVKCPTFSKRD